MNRNNTYFERIIKRALMEQDEVPAAPTSSGDEVPVPPSQSTITYYILGADGKTDPTKYTADQLKTKNLTSDSVVNNKTLGGWKPIKDVPELSSIISSSPNKQATPSSSSSGDVTMDAPPPGASKSFFDYCPTAKGKRDMTNKNYANLQQSETDMAISRGGGLEEVNTIADKYFKAQGDFDKKTFLGSCMDELRLALKDKPEEVLKFQGPLNKWLAKDGKELGKKALTAGGNILLNIANKALQAKGLGSLKMENTIKKNTKNNLMEIYNRKNRRR
jgi:hypothetical protein